MCQLDEPSFLPDDVVRVIDDIAEVHRLQILTCSWDDDMTLVCYKAEQLIFPI